MTIVAIDVGSPVPPFEQLRQQLDQYIRRGTLQAGEQLPTVRQLARDLGLAKNTVARAYQALERDGLVVGDRRRGTIVLEQTKRAGERDDLIESATQRYLSELDGLGASLDEALAAVRAAFAQRATQIPPTRNSAR